MAPGPFRASRLPAGKDRQAESTAAFSELEGAVAVGPLLRVEFEPLLEEARRLAR